MILRSSYLLLYPLGLICVIVIGSWSTYVGVLMSVYWSRNGLNSGWLVLRDRLLVDDWLRDECCCLRVGEGDVGGF